MVFVPADGSVGFPEEPPPTEKNPTNQVLSTVVVKDLVADVPVVTETPLTSSGED